MRKAGILIFVLLLMVSLSMTGCSEDTATGTSVSTPSASVLNPTGTIQGRLLDKVTQQPIAGAVIAIGVASAATDANGQFVLANIPATQGADMDGNSVTTGSYEVTINMLGVTSPVSMATATVNKYAKHYIKSAYVEYATLNDSGGSTAGSGSGTNHDTVITGLVATADFRVGKLSASIAGEVGGCAGTANFLTSVGAGYTVKVVATGSDNSGTGAGGNVVGTTTTIATGFQFTGLEAGTSYTIYAESADHLFRSDMTQAVATRGDSEVTYLLNQESTALHVCPVDTHGPYVIAVSPEPLSDLSTIGTTTVTITFNEAVAQTAYTTTTGGPVANLFDDIEVVYAGMKAGNIPYTLAWAAGNTQLQISFTTGVSGKYYVRILDIDGGNFKDANNQNADMGICKDDSAAPAAYGIAANAGANDCTVYFTTSGAPTASAVANLVWVNDGLIDTAGQATLDWTAISGAKKYNVYRRKNQIWGATTINHDYVKIDTSTGSFYADSTGPNGINEGGAGDDGNLPMVENNEIKLTYDYMVRAVNSDGLESGNSNVVTVSDKIGPALAAVAATFRADLVDMGAGVRQIVVPFNEAMDEASVINPANWLFSSSTLTAGSIQRVIYNAGTFVATVWLNFDKPLAGIARTEIIAGTNGVFEGTAAVTDGQLMPNGVVSGGVCVSPQGGTGDVTGELVVAANAADTSFLPANSIYTANTIFTGASGTCDTAGSATDDTQTTIVGQTNLSSSLVGISAATFTRIVNANAFDTVVIGNTAADFVLGTAPAALDAVSRKVFITLDTTAVRDVAGNLIKTTTTAPTAYGNRVNTDGTMQSN